jgi:RES domain-containing protein
MTIVRLCRSRYSPNDATGAKLHGGRWSSPGNAVLYASSTLALACLEVLVHIRNVGLLPLDYVFCEIEAPDVLISPWTFTGEAAVARIESPVLSREYGDAWFRRTPPQLLAAVFDVPSGQFSLLERPAPVQTVPSVIVPREMNYLISPVHPQFDLLQWGAPKPFRFDPRLIGSTAD